MYIGQEPATSFTGLIKQDFTVSATTSYTLSHSVNNANDIALYRNFVRQEPTTAYSCTGTSLTLTSATVSGDDLYCIYLGQALQTVNPANASVGNSQVAPSLINSQTAETSIADADEVLIYDSSASALRKMTKANFVSGVGGTNTPAFEGYSTNGQAPSDATETKIELDGESFDTDSAFDTSTYRFTVPSGEGGKYYVYGNIAVDSQADSTLRYAYIRIKKNGSTDLLDSYYNFTDNNPRDVAILVHGTVTLSAGDYIELYGYMDDTNNSGLDFKGASGTRLATLMGGYKLIGV